MINTPLHIAVLMGGFGSEKEVSLKSGKTCSEALKKLKYNVSEIIVDNFFDKKINDIKPDICFNALHGKFGEDGTIQGYLNTIKIPYTHSGVETSSIAMNKIFTKQIITNTTKKFQNPIIFPETLEWESFLKSKYKKPFVIKPISGGSSVGVRIINRFKDNKLCSFLKNRDNYMIEPLVGNRELTVAVLDGEPLTVTEILPQKPNTFYDYDSKYEINGSSHQIPADIPNLIFQKSLDWAKRSHSILKCKGVSRTDFRFDDKSNKLYMLEINTQPGMTKTSLVPEQAKFKGINMTNLVKKLIEKADFEK